MQNSHLSAWVQLAEEGQEDSHRLCPLQEPCRGEGSVTGGKQSISLPDPSLGPGWLGFILSPIRTVVQEDHNESGNTGIPDPRIPLHTESGLRRC